MLRVVVHCAAALTIGQHRIVSWSDHWSVCPHVVKEDEQTSAATCRWLTVDGRNSLRYDLPYTMYVSAVNTLARVNSTKRTFDTAAIGW